MTSERLTKKYGKRALLFLQLFYEFIAVTRNPLARFFDDRDGAFFAFRSDKQFGIGKLKLDHVPGDIDVRIAQDFFDEGVHERMPFALNNESRFILFKFKYFYYHSTYVGNFGNY